MAGIRKRLKKVAKKLAAPIKKVAKAHVKIIKKLEKSKIIKKIAKPLAYAVGAATGTLAIVAKADQIRTTARQAKAKFKSQKEALKAQFAIADEKLGIEPAQEQAATVEPVEQQAAPEPMVYDEPEPMQASFAPVQQSFAPIQQAAPRQAPVQVQRQQAAPQTMVYDEPEPQYQAPPTLAPFAQGFVSNRQAQAHANSYGSPVSRITPAEAEEQPRVVGISATGIMDNIKANPLPWMAGAAVAAYLVTNRKTSYAK